MVQKLSKIRTSLVSVKTGSVKSFENAYRGVATGGTRAARGLWHPHFNFPTKKVQQFQFQTSGILFFMGVQKLC